MSPGLPDPFDLPFEDEPSDSGLSCLPPSVDDDDDRVASTRYDYSVRRPGTYVISGPWGDHRPNDPRRRFRTAEDAHRWAVAYMGHRGPVRRIHEAEDGGQWACEVCRDLV